jgi:hypothetical protein
MDPGKRNPMLHLRLVSLASLPVIALFACTTVDQPLGDTSAGQSGAGGSSAGAGGAAGGTGGTGETGGTGQTGGRAGAPATGGAAGRGGSTGGRAGSGGSGNESGEAGAPSTGGTAGRPSTDCYSPANPRPALLGEAEGCPCGAADEEQCIRTTGDNGQHHFLAFICSDGRWASVEDGACGNVVAHGCVVNDRLYREGDGHSFGSPFDICNSCTCAAGGLVCTEIGCPAATCPEGTVLGTACLSCGSPGGCGISEHGCVQTCDDARDCPMGSCDEGICSVTHCI